MNHTEPILRQLAHAYQELHKAANPGQEEVWIMEIPMPEKVTPLIMMRIPAGYGWVGVKSPANEYLGVQRHRVHIQEEFWMGQTPVTGDQWAVMNSKEPGKKTALPKVEVSWNDVTQLLKGMNKVGSKFRQESGIWRLPFETEWEYVCRAGSLSEYWNGEDEAALAEVGWYRDNSKSSLRTVGEFPSERAMQHPYGLLHMHGLVWEWCQDEWQDDPFVLNAPERIGLEGDDKRAKQSPDHVVRGGSWRFGAERCRSSNRGRGHPDDRGGNLGFRLCLSPGPLHASKQ